MAVPKTEPKIYVGVALDFETGGLDCVKHACTQIAMQAVRFDTWEVFKQYVCYFSPYQKQELGGTPKRKVLRSKYELDDVPLMEYENVALTYSAITMEMLHKMGVNYKKIATDIIEFGKQATLSKGMQTKPVLLGQNIQFDIGFLQQLMNYANLIKEFESTYAGRKDFYGNFQPHYIDTIDLARLSFAHDPAVTSYKLELIAERLGIELDDAHDAAADVTATINVASICSGKLRNNEEGTVTMIKKEKTRLHFKI